MLTSLEILTWSILWHLPFCSNDRKAELVPGGALSSGNCLLLGVWQEQGTGEVVVTASSAVLAAKPCALNPNWASVQSPLAGLTTLPRPPLAWRAESFLKPALPPARQAEVLLAELCQVLPRAL